MICMSFIVNWKLTDLVILLYSNKILYYNEIDFLKDKRLHFNS